MHRVSHGSRGDFPDRLRRTPGPDQTVQREAELYQIDQVERTFHQAGSTHNVNLMMSLFAPGAVFNLGLETFSGKPQIRKFFATKNPAFAPQTITGSPTRRHTRSE